VIQIQEPWPWSDDDWPGEFALAEIGAGADLLRQRRRVLANGKLLIGGGMWHMARIAAPKGDHA
jgi:hypothetical protein